MTSTRPQISYLHVFYFGIHALSLFIVVDAIRSGISGKAIVLCLASYWIRYLFLAIGYHRYFAHRSFKTSRAFQLLLAVFGSLSAQRGVLWWAQTHRYHHRHADTPLDIHSPSHQGFWYSHCGWFLNPAHRQTDLSQVRDLAKFPELAWLDRFNWVVFFAFALAMYSIFGWPGFAWGVCVSTVLAWHTTHFIQSISHSFGGYRNYATSDDSRNHWLMGLIAWGDGFHNNHHQHPSSARHGVYWWEIDLGYGVLRVLQALHLIWDVRQPRIAHSSQRTVSSTAA